MPDEIEEIQPEERAEESTAEGARAAQSRDTPGLEATGPVSPPSEGVLTLVCLQCGAEYYFDTEPPPAEMTCEKCGGTVFRSFFSPREGAEAAQDFEDSTARDLDPDDAEGEAMPGDVLDLDNL
jgi:hypothetical protein